MTDGDEKQPQKGDTVLYCAHDVASGLHWWRVAMGFRRPDGSVGEAKWLAACDACFVASAGNALAVRVAGDGTWDGSPVTFRAQD